ncbi:RFC checkpoint protein Rad17 [Ophidiomyces ophidiicola]|nr:RFC checkpoint protein Rad17 [Ophidiomyces ophidiicola]
MTAAPPRKRQRRLVVQSSDDEAASSSTSTLRQGLKTRLNVTRADDSTAAIFSNTSTTKRHPPRPSRKPAARLATPSSHTSPTSSPEKRKSRNQNSAGKSLHSYFATATEEQRWSKAVDTTSTPDAVEEIEDEEDDITWDWNREQSSNIGTGAGYVQRDNVNGRTRPLGREEQPNGSQTSTVSNVSRTTKRFLLPADAGIGRSAGLVEGGQLRPWAERFAPANLDELAVHKKKVADVQSWLADVFAGRSRKRILVLRGPAGSGKTTTISLLSKALSYDIIEWKSYSGEQYMSPGYVSMSAQFEDFLGRSDKFHSLTLSGESDGPIPDARNGDSNSSGNSKRIILVEEFPASLSPGSSALMAFRSTLQQYIAAAVPPHQLRGVSAGQDLGLSPPLVIVVSETLLGTGAAISDNFTVHRLLGAEVSNHPGVSIIDFNRMAPTFITKALDLVLKKEARVSKRRRVPGPAALKVFADMGDVRSAISSLEFMCLRGDADGIWSGTIASRIRRGVKSVGVLTETEKDSLEAITQREASLGIFHAVGKVVYNKRQDPTIIMGPSAQAPQPPEHLPQFARQKVSEVSIDSLINETGTDIQTFIAALHENYILSCTSDDFTDIFADCISELSDADVLSPDARPGGQPNRGGTSLSQFSSLTSGTSIDVLRQDEISFLVAVRGLLFSLPYPVKRRAVPGVSGGDVHKMFFPTSMRLWRKIEEFYGLLDVWTSRLMNPTFSDRSSGSATRSEGVESWGSRLTFGGVSQKEDVQGLPAAGRLMMSSQEMLLDYLPYLRMVSKDASKRRDLAKITQFYGSFDRHPNVSDLDLCLLENPEQEHWVTDPVPKSPQKNRMSRNGPPVPSHKLPLQVRGLAPEVETAVDSLVLSDDDIED